MGARALQGTESAVVVLRAPSGGARAQSPCGLVPQPRIEAVSPASEGGFSAKKSLSCFKKHQQNRTIPPPRPSIQQVRRCAEPSPLSSWKQERTALPHPTPLGRCPPSAGRSVMSLLSGQRVERCPHTDFVQQHAHSSPPHICGSFSTIAPLRSTRQKSV